MSVVERLKQKAKSGEDIYLSIAEHYQFSGFERGEKWVRLDDVLEMLKDLLKTRPKITKEIDDYDEKRDEKWLEAYDLYYAEMEHWFEHFEKKLEELLRNE